MTRSFDGHRLTRLRPKTRAGHFLRLDQNLKPRMKSLWHPGYFLCDFYCDFKLTLGAQVCRFLLFFSLDGIFRTSTGFVECYQPHPLPLFLPLSFEATESIQFTLCFLAQHGLSFASKKTVLPKIQNFTNQL